MDFLPAIISVAVMVIPFSSTLLDLILNFQTSWMTINMCIYNLYMFLIAAFSSKYYVIPSEIAALFEILPTAWFWKCFTKQQASFVIHCFTLEHKQSRIDFLVCWSEEIIHFLCLVENSSKVWVTFCTFFSLVPNKEALVLFYQKIREMAHQVTKLAVNQQTPLCRKILLTSMTRWTKRMRMMMMNQFSRLSHLKWIRSVAVPLFLPDVCTAACELYCALSYTASLTFQSMWFNLINAQ